MRNLATSSTTSTDATLDAWLSAVTAHLAERRHELRSRPSGARERQRARREARRLFAEYRDRIAEAHEASRDLATAA